ncbi:MAG: hypothetical protein WD737_07220 [Gemmatimonadota bacterium]
MANDRQVDFTPPPATGGIDQGTDSGTGSDASTGRFEEASERASHAAQDAKEKARGKAEEVRDRAADAAEERAAEQKYRAAESLGDVAHSLRTASEQMPQDNDVGRYMVQAADQVQNLANFLDNRDVAQMVDDVEDFARRQPTAFVGGAFALGVLGARFLKSSRGGSDERRLRDEFERSGFGTTGVSGIDDPARDSISRPAAPGYAAPSERDVSGDGAGDFR